jgi:hypothetical protein
MASDARLVIVRRGHFATFELLARTFADDPTVRVIWDRRMSDRRRSNDQPAADRRSRDRRRTPPPQWRTLNYMIAGTELT